MTDAFWHFMGIAVPAGISAIAAYFARGAKQSSKENATTLNEVHNKVNGNLEKAVSEARRTLPPQVLIIDDDANDLLLARRALKAFGCDVFEAQNGEAAKTLILSRIGSARGLPFDFVFVDMRLNGSEDGAEILKDLAALSTSIRVIVLTGYPDGSEVKRACAESARMVITKPLRETHIQSLLDQYTVPYTKAKP